MDETQLTTSSPGIACVMKRQRSICSGVRLAVAITSFIAAAAFAQLLPPVEVLPDGTECVRGEVLVQFSATVTEVQIANAFRQGGLTLIKHVQTPAMADSRRVGITRASTSLPIPAALRILNNLPDIAFAEPNFVVTSQAESDDPFYLNGSLWGMYGDDLPAPIGGDATTNPFGSQAEKVWAAGIIGSKDVVVGVIDQGIQLDHPDLADNLWSNPAEIPSNLLDEDANGYLDDIHGWNAIDDNGAIYDPGYDDHGTHVAGIIGAIGGNGIGVAGVNWDVTLISGKFLGRDNRGSVLNAIETIDYVVSLKTRKGLNIVALNHSWGTSGFSQALLDSITRAAQAGILSVVAAMNDATNIDVAPRYPACFDTTATAGYDAVIAVASTTKYGAKRVTSNWGATNVDLGAPGEDVLSTVPPGAYGYKSGTSMATPHVTGAIALYASTHPADAPWEIRNNLLAYGVRPLDALQGITVTGGILDVAAFVSLPAAPLPAPAAPVSFQAALLSGGYVSLSWSDQANNELGFAIERSTDGQTFYLADTVGADITRCLDRTARPDTTYFYRVRSFNPGGSSDYAYAAGSVTTPHVSLPLAPTSLTAAVQPAGKGGGVLVAWKDNANNEDAFQIFRKTGSAGSWQLLAVVGANTTKYTDRSTVSKVAYSYRVRACNPAGSSAYSNEVSVTTK